MRKKKRAEKWGPVPEAEKCNFYKENESELSRKKNERQNPENESRKSRRLVAAVQRDPVLRSGSCGN